MPRARALLAIPLLAAALAAAGCSSSSSSSAGSTSTAVNSSVAVSGAFGSAPKVTIPAQKADNALTVKTVIQGNGPTLASSDEFLGNYVAYVWSGTTHKLATSTYSAAPTLLSNKLLPGLATALHGKTTGSRVLAVIPPKDAFGSQGNSQLGIKPTDTLVFVIDVIQRFGATQAAQGTSVSNGGGNLPTVAAGKAGTAPTVTIPKSAPSSSLVSKVLIKGSGAAVAKGQEIVVQYTGVNYRTAKVFDSSWSRSAPFAFQLDASPSQVIPGWDKALTGQTIGSRVLLVIPPADGYGKAGASQAGIKGTDTLVFVVDILGAAG